MRLRPPQHLDSEQLLRYLDGELPARKTREAASHLEACWECRVELEELQKTVAECVRYRKDLIQAFPAPPAPWPDIHRRFAEVDAAVEPGFFFRLGQMLQWPTAQGWAVAVVALLVAVVLVYRFRQTPSVQAAELLQKAITAAEARPEKPRRIRIRTKDREVSRLAGAHRKLAAEDAGSLDSVKSLFVAARYNWDDPLSAKSFQAWRNQLPEKRDEIVEQQNSYVIRTDTGSGELKEAALTLRTADLQPIQERLEFRNAEWVEITDLGAEENAPLTIAGAPSSSGVPAIAPTAALPSSTVAPNAPASATIGDELHVMAALHQAGADLGDPLEVSSTGGDVMVTGAGIAPERQREIRDLLGSRPHVIVRFADAAPARTAPEKVATETPASGELSQLQARIAEQIGGRSQFEEIAGRAFDLSDAMMSRVYALRRLADRFPKELESELTADDRQLLKSLRHDHIVALGQQTADLDGVLRPVLGPLGDGRAPGPAPLSGPWQPATEEIFQSARQFEKLLAVTFGAAPGDASGKLPSQLLSNLAQLRSRLDAYDRLPDRSNE